MVRLFAGPLKYVVDVEVCRFRIDIPEMKLRWGSRHWPKHAKHKIDHGPERSDP
jgi:hypothetical protein